MWQRARFSKGGHTNKGGGAVHEPVDLFATQWRLLGGEVVLADAAVGWSHTIEDVLAGVIDPAFPTVVGFDTGDWPKDVPWSALCETIGARFYDRHDLDVLSRQEALQDIVAHASVGVTGAAWAAADTGTVALYASAQTSLSASLLPPTHVVLLPKRRIYATLAEGLRAVHAQGAVPHLVKLISGPSMTADIEGQLVVGVHGPRRVVTVIGDW
ncbi:hypothetical protein CO251_05215 [Sulfobacillus sp. hq2]|nr:hypothetical protein CO251_05215 [Sulfobacillus sp. hq2]